MKRAQEAAAKDANEAGGARSPERPWTPTPMPDPGLARGRRVRRLLGVLCLAGAAAGAAYLLLRGRAAEETARDSASVPAPSPRSAPAAPAAAAAAPTELPVVVVPTPPRARRSEAPASSPAAPAPAPSTDAAPPGPVHAAAAVPTAPAPPPPRLGAARTYAGGVTLPGGEKIELGGIAWSEEDPRALLNDRIVAVGGFVAGYSVSKIETDRVELRKDGATIVLTVK